MKTKLIEEKVERWDTETTVSTQFKWIHPSRLQSFLALSLVAFFLGHFVLLSPSNLEEDFMGVRVINPKDLLNFLKNEPTSVIKAVPVDVTPDYSLRDMEFYNTTKNKPSWKLTARKSNVYQTANIIHCRDLILELSDHTTVQSREGVYYTNQDVGEFYGDVVTTLANGTVVYSQYARVKTKPITEISIPMTEPVLIKKQNPKSFIIARAYGLTYSDSPPQEFKLLNKVEVEIIGDKHTWIYSDYARFLHMKNHLYFEMNDQQPLERQFAMAKQVDMDLKSRTIEAQLDDKDQFETITALKDVTIHDFHDEAHPSTSTSGKATYFEAKDEIHLYDFPQVYQDGDTITGDVIVYNRATDIVEVKQSNGIYKH